MRPELLSYVPDEVHFKDGKLDITGWYFKQPKGKVVKARLLFFHGNAENVSSHFVSLYWLLEHGYEFLIYDYPGYGISEGRPTPENTVTSGLAAARWLREQSPATPIAFFGQSLGGAVTLTTALSARNEMPICLVTVESTFASYKRAARSIMANSWVTWLFQPLAYILFSDKSAPKGHLKELAPIPLIVVHGEDDPMIDIQLGRNLFDEAAEPKEFWPVPGGSHGDAFTRQEFRQKLLGKLTQYCHQK